MMRRIEARVSPISVSTGVPAIGKKRIRCSGGGSGITFSMRWSSVWLVRSLLASQPSVGWLDEVVMTIGSWTLAMTKRRDKKKTAGLEGPAVFGD